MSKGHKCINCDEYTKDGHFVPPSFGDKGFFICKRRFRPDEPCSHPGCLNHISHPCEGCGRIAGRYPEE